MPALKSNRVSDSSPTQASTDNSVTSLQASEKLGSKFDEKSIKKADPTLQQLLHRYWPFMLITWLFHIGLGISISITGPTLPYLALNSSQTLGSAGFLYTVRSVVVCVTCLFTGFVLGKLQTSRAKILLLLCGSCAGMTSAFLVPFMTSPVMLLLAQSLFGVGTGIGDTANNMLVIYLFGPVLSRSLSHSLHFCVGAGGLLAPLLARPFLEQMGDVAAGGSICGGYRNVTSLPSAADAVNLDPLKWPYIILGSVNAIWIIGYGLLLIKDFQLHKLEISISVNDQKEGEDVDQVDANVDRKSQNVGMSVGRKATIVSLFVLFFVLHVGQENTFWSHLYTFGVCSSLRLSAGRASALSTVFFAGFLSSRAIGIVVAKFVSPTKILISQLIGCLVATSLLAIWGDSIEILTFICSCLYGFCIAMVFPTGITWLASKMDVTGYLSSSWFIGAYIGNSTYPLAAGALIESAAGAISMMYLAAGTSAVYLCVASVMFLIAM